jgi:lysozyme
MEISASGLELIRRFEGFRGSTYLDACGIPTIGYGHKILRDESFPDGISEARARELLAADAAIAARAVERLVKVPLTQGQFDALADFCFNVGSARLAASTLLRDLNAGDYTAARRQLLRWDHAGDAVLPGLKARRQAEFDLWSSAVPEIAAQELSA